jgi:hypothetical protein
MKSEERSESPGGRLPRVKEKNNDYLVQTNRQVSYEVRCGGHALIHVFLNEKVEKVIKPFPDEDPHFSLYLYLTGMYRYYLCHVFLLRESAKRN